MRTILYFNSRKEYLEKRIAELERAISKYAPGTLICYENGNTYKYYNQEYLPNGQKKRTYIHKDKLQLVKDLALKAYHSRELQDMKNELLAINRYLRARSTPHSNDYLDPKSPYSKLLPKNLIEWESIEYDKSNEHPEKLTVKAPNGLFVRSKSEAMIAYVLTDYKIPFRYECALNMFGTKIYPDFTILHPTARKEYIWEHFGLIDDFSYRDKTIFKLKNYMTNGYIPGHNLITTFESKDMPLDINYVENLVQFYFS